MKDLVYDIAKQQLSDTTSQLLILHPNYRNKRLLLNDLIETHNTCYVRFDGKNLNSDDVQQQLQRGLDGTPLTDVQLLILDECDRVEPDTLDAFIENVTNTLFTIDSTRIVLITRQIPRFVTHPTNYQIRMLPVDNDLMLCDYIRQPDAPNLLEVHGFGDGRVLLNGVEITRWDGLLPRSLFFYLVDRGMTTRDDIFGIFWPKLTVKEATNVFHVTKRKINEILGVNLTIYWSGYYRISPDLALSYDVMNFSQMVQDSGVIPDDQAKQLLSRAIWMYRGAFLTSLHTPWVENRRHALLQTYGEALVSLARLSQGAGESRRALGLYLRSALTNPHREDLVEHIMQLYDELRMYADALVVYDRLVQELNDTLGVEPAPHLQQLAASIRAKMT